MTTSPGQARCIDDVIIASTTCRELALNSAAEHTSAGRRLAAARSVKGNGTTTTSPGLKVGVRIVVVRGVPLGSERCFERVQFEIAWRRLSQTYGAEVSDEELDAVAGADLKRLVRSD